VKTVTVNRLEVRDAASVLQNYIKEDGWMQPRYRDEYAAGDLAYGQGGAAEPPVTTVNIAGTDDGDGNTTLQMRLRAFVRTSANRVAYGSFEINHDVDVSGALPLEAHVHFIPIATPVAGNTVVWTLDYAVMNFDAAALIQAQVSTSTVLAVADEGRHKIAAFGDATLPAPTGGWHIGSIVPWALRLSSTSTYAGSVALLKAAMHVPVDGLGSRQRIVK